MLSQAVAGSFVVALMVLVFLVGRAAWRFHRRAHGALRRAHGALDRWQDDAVKRFPLALLVLLPILAAPAGAAPRPTLKVRPAVSSHPVVGPLVTYLVDPCRFLDSRDSEVFWYEADGPFLAESYRYYQLQGNCGVPFGAQGAVLNITVTGATAAGHLLVYDAWGHDRIPPVSTLNFGAGQTIANGLTVRLSPTTAGSIYADFRVFTRIPDGGSVHVIIDVVGYLVAP